MAPKDVGPSQVSRRAAALGGLAALALCCVPTSPATPPSPDPEVERARERDALRPRVERLSARAAELLRSQHELVWRSWTEGVRATLDDTYRGQEELFGVESARLLERYRQLVTDPQEIRALTYLRVYVVGEHLARELGDLSEAIANLEASLTFTAGGKDHPYRDLERLLAAERDAERRRELYEGATSAVERISQSLRRREDKLGELLGALGYPSYEAFGAELRQADLERLSLLAEEILQATSAPYAEVIDRLAIRELGLPLQRLRRSDFPRLFRSRGVDAAFPRDQVMPRVERTLEGLGFPLSGLPSVRVDLREARPGGKNPRPLTLPVRVPADVRLSYAPVGGARDQALLLHEIGHVLHYAMTRPMRFELAELGNRAVSEAYAHLFADLVVDPVWLTEHAGLTGDRQAEYLAASSAQRLFEIREAAGRLLYQLQLRRNQPVNPRELYAQIMQRTYGVRLSEADAARYLLDLEDFYASADDFRAWFLAGQLQGQLKGRFGPAWWRERAAGEFLRALWAHGNALSARELAQQWGEDRIIPDVLLLRLGTTLSVPIRLPAHPPAPPRPRPQPRPSPGAQDGGIPSVPDAN